MTIRNKPLASNHIIYVPVPNVMNNKKSSPHSQMMNVIEALAIVGIEAIYNDKGVLIRVTDEQTKRSVKEVALRLGYEVKVFKEMMPRDVKAIEIWHGLCKEWLRGAYALKFILSDDKHIFFSAISYSEARKIVSDFDLNRFDIMEFSANKWHWSDDEFEKHFTPVLFINCWENIDIDYTPPENRYRGGYDIDSYLQETVRLAVLKWKGIEDPYEWTNIISNYLKDEMADKRDFIEHEMYQLISDIKNGNYYPDPFSLSPLGSIPVHSFEIPMELHINFNSYCALNCTTPENLLRHVVERIVSSWKGNMSAEKLMKLTKFGENK